MQIKATRTKTDKPALIEVYESGDGYALTLVWTTRGKAKGISVAMTAESAASLALALGGRTHTECEDCDDVPGALAATLLPVREAEPEPEPAPEPEPEAPRPQRRAKGRAKDAPTSGDVPF